MLASALFYPPSRRVKRSFLADGLFLGTQADGGRCALEPKALTTHGFILGMTGSGKTGLCVIAVEELLRAGVPVIAVDSKGDLATVLLALDPADGAAFARWSGDGPAAAARATAALAAAGLSRDEANALRARYEPRLYTPGSSLGLPVDLLGSLAPPADGSPDALAEAADALARGLLGLLGIDADPVSSREYLLLVQLLTTAWQQQKTPTLVDLVRQVGQPPFAAVGALPLEDFFPQKDRSTLMVRLNGLVASPKFAAWRQGEPLDPGLLWRAPDGRPRLSVYSVAHLTDEERVYAVAQLLERVQGWMRKQGGAPSVRGVVLLDEIYGYFPPAPANPPTKPPLIALLKQARAFGVAVVLATQNPIDLDYRGLANIGTWLVGRLQTDQDKARIRDALLGAASASGLSSAQVDDLIAKLQPRQFLLHSVHRPQPTVFTTRDTWTVLHAPFSADEVRALAAPMKAAAGVGAAGVGAAGVGAAGVGAAGVGAGGVLGGAVAGVAAGVLGGAGLGGGPASGPGPSVGSGAAPAAIGVPAPIDLEPELGPLYEVDRGTALPFLLLKFGVRYRLGTAVSEETMHELAFPLEGSLGPAEVLEGAPYSVKGVQFQAAPPEGMALTALPGWVANTKAYKMASAIRDRLPSKLETKLLYDAQTRLISGPTESREAFTARLLEKQDLSRDAQRLVRTLEKKKADLAQADREVSSRKAEKWLQVGSGVLGLFSGRRSSLGGVARAVSSHRYQGGAEGKVEDLRIEVEQLERQLAELKEIDPRRVEEQLCVPRASDVQVLRLCVAFIVP